MARGLTVRVEGVNELRAAIRKAKDDEAKKALTAVHREAAKLVGERARELAPRRSGTLAKSIRWSGGQRDGKVRSGVVYGPPIHWGWPKRNIEGQPFISDAVSDKYDEVRELVETRIGEIMAALDTTKKGT